MYEELRNRMQEGVQLLCSGTDVIIREFVIYGLGSIEDNRVSRFQA